VPTATATTADVDVPDTADTVVSDEPLAPDATVADDDVAVAVDANATLYEPGVRYPNEYAPDAFVVAVTGLPPLRTGLPLESSNVTVTPGTADPPEPRLPSPALPVRVLPHWAADVGADTVSVSESEANAVVTAPVVDDPDPVTVTLPGRRAAGSTGPNVTGQIANAVTRVHNCGASPITLIVACGAVEYVGLSNVTRKSRSAATHAEAPEPPDTGSEDKSSTPLEGIVTSCQPDNTAPVGSRTVNRAPVHCAPAPIPAIRKSTHC
jgi:hypothetical protein